MSGKHFATEFLALIQRAEAKASEKNPFLKDYPFIYRATYDIDVTGGRLIQPPTDTGVQSIVSFLARFNNLETGDHLLTVGAAYADVPRDKKLSDDHTQDQNDSNSLRHFAETSKEGWYNSSGRLAYELYQELLNEPGVAPLYDRFSDECVAVDVITGHVYFFFYAKETKVVYHVAAKIGDGHAVELAKVAQS